MGTPVVETIRGAGAAGAVPAAQIAASTAAEKRAKARAKAAQEAKEKAEKAAKKAKEAAEKAAKKAKEAAEKAAKEAKKKSPKPKPTPKPTKSPTPTPTQTTSAPPSSTSSAPATSAPATSSSAPSSSASSSSAPSTSVPPTPPPDNDDGEEREYDSQADFASHQMQQGSPATEFREAPHYEVELGVSNRDLVFPDGAEFEMWVFDNDDSGRGFPSPTLRPREDQIFHATVEPSMGPHTIHWHGMEPDPRNDGVGHTSFEIDDVYTYQWKPERGRAGDPNYGAAGTYFYHCHVNTPLHAQMGLLGPLIIDPIVLPEFPVRAGTRRAFADGPLYDIETESFLMPYALDPRWHTLDHAAGLSGEDVGLNRFEPTHFYITGGLLASRVEREGAVWATAELPINIETESKAPSLMRLLDGNYLPNKLRFTGPDGSPARIAELIAHDGRPFRHTSVPGAPAIPTSMQEDKANRLMTDVVAIGAAERYDILLHPEVAGEYTMSVEWFHWITGKLLATRTMRLMAS